jgi:hypothetical protein
MMSIEAQVVGAKRVDRNQDNQPGVWRNWRGYFIGGSF